MANQVLTRFHQPLPHGGADASGRSKQNKVEVRGEISVTTYDKNGESLTPIDLGLNVIDWLDIKHENNAAGKEGSEPRFVRYNFATNEFYIVEEAAGSHEPANAGSHTLYFNAFGDTAREAELL